MDTLLKYFLIIGILINIFVVAKQERKNGAFAIMIDPSHFG